MLFEEIEALKSELSDLEIKLIKRQQEVKKLKIGQEIYTQDSAGYLEPDEYYSVIVLDIDHERARVFIHEKSLDAGDTSWAAEHVKRWIETYRTTL